MGTLSWNNLSDGEKQSLVDSIRKGGSGTFTGGSIANDSSMATGKSFSADADKIIGGSNIIPQTKTIHFFATLGSTSRTIFIADEAYQIVSFYYHYPGTASTGTWHMEKLTGSTADGSGTTIFSGNVSAVSAQATPTTASLTSTTADLQLAAGDRIGWTGNLNNNLLFTGVLTLKRI